jgi:hypothetical protein
LEGTENKKEEKTREEAHRGEMRKKRHKKGEARKKKGNPIRSSETSVSNHLTPRNNPKDGKTNFNHGGSLRFFDFLSAVVHLPIRHANSAKSWKDSSVVMS